MGWISRLFQGSELDRARDAAEASKERTDAEARDFERWLAAIPSEDRTTKAAAHGLIRTATAAAEKGDVQGWQEAREQFELARAAYRRGREELALANPREAATLLLADAAEGAAQIRDVEDRSARAAGVAEIQAYCGDLQGARLTLEQVTEPADRAGAERALLIARATSQTLDASRLAEALAAAESNEWSHEEILFALVEDRCRRGDISGAKPLLEPIEDPDLRARALRSLAHAEARAGRLDEARALAKRIEDPRWSSVVWSDLAHVQAIGGDPSGALETAVGIQDEGARATALGAIAGALVEAGDDARANEVVERIGEPGARDDALTWIAEAHARKGNFTGAAAAIEDIQDPLVHAQELASLAEAAQTARKDELAGTFLQRALEGFETVRSTRNYPPSWLGRYLVDARSRVGDFEGAEAVVRAIGEERERAELLGDLAMHVAHRAGGGLVALEGLLDRHPGVLEQIAIRLHGAQGFLLRAQARSAEHAPPASSRQGSSGTP